MKRLKLLGEVLSKAQQKQIYGGYGEKVILYCKKADTNTDPCEIELDKCPEPGTNIKTCLESTTCYDYVNSASC
jgi:hypothetical protein